MYVRGFSLHGCQSFHLIAMQRYGQKKIQLRKKTELELLLEYWNCYWNSL